MKWTTLHKHTLSLYTFCYSLHSDTGCRCQCGRRQESRGRDVGSRVAGRHLATLSFGHPPGWASSTSGISQTAWCSCRSRRALKSETWLEPTHRGKDMAWATHRGEDTIIMHYTTSDSGRIQDGIKRSGKPTHAPPISEIYGKKKNVAHALC